MKRLRPSPNPNPASVEMRECGQLPSRLPQCIHSRHRPTSPGETPAAAWERYRLPNGGCDQRWNRLIALYEYWTGFGRSEFVVRLSESVTWRPNVRSNSSFERVGLALLTVPITYPPLSFSLPHTTLGWTVFAPFSYAAAHSAASFFYFYAPGFSLSLKCALAHPDTSMFSCLPFCARKSSLLCISNALFLYCPLT